MSTERSSNIHLYYLLKMKLLLLLIVFFVVGVLYVLKLKRQHDRSKQISGQLQDLPSKTTKDTSDKLSRIDLPGSTMVLATHPDSAKFILSDTEHFPKLGFGAVKNSYKLWQKNVAFTNGDQWRKYRNVLSPPFHFDAVRKWIPDFHNLVVELLQHWDRTSYNVDITHWMPMFTLDVLGVTVLGQKFNAMNGTKNDDIKALNILMRGKTSEPIQEHDLNNATDHLYKSMLDIVTARKTSKAGDGHFDLINVMLSAHDPSWSEDELVSNAFIMFVAGHETTATALEWLVYHLALHQDVQHKVKQEVDAVLKGQPITEDSLKELTYLTNVIKENLRIQPPAGFVPTRIAVEDVQFEDKIIPKGSRVGVNIWAIHHDPNYWSNPMEFDPDRFTKPISPFSYLPFSLKSRSCLGNQFSLVEQTVFVATLLQQYKIESIASVTLPASVEGRNKLPELKVKLSRW